MTTGKFVADGDRAQLRNLDVHAGNNTAFKLVAILA